MRERQTVSGMQLRLLALVLALALIWYAMNPAPGPARRVKKVEGPQDEEWREAETAARTGRGLELIEEGSTHPYEPSVSVGEGDNADDLEWPELIDL